MGWFSDFISDPVGTVTEAVNPVIQSVAQVGGNIVDPLNLTPVTEMGKKFVSEENLKGYGNVAAGAGLTYSTGGYNILGQAQGAQSTLRDPTLSGLTFGASKDFADLSSGSGKLLSGGSATEQEWAGTYRFGVKSAIAAGTAAGISAYGATGSQVGLGYGAAQNLARGNVAGAVSVLPGGSLINQLIPLPTGAPPRQPTLPYSGDQNFYPNYEYPYDSPLSTQGGFFDSSDSGSSPYLIPMVLVFSAGIIFVLKKRGII